MESVVTSGEGSLAVLQIVQRVGSVLDLFTRARPEWSVGDVAVALGAPRSTVHEWLSGLVAAGLLQRGGGGRYVIGWRALQLSEVHRRSVSVSEAAEGVLERLVAVTGETAHVAVARRSRVLYTRRFVARRRVSVAVPPTGLPLEMHCSAVGKVLLAARPVEQQTVLASRLSS